MNSNLIGILLIAVGSFASAVYYVPLKKLKNWSWETGWIVQGIFAWILGPWIVAMITVPHLFEIIGQSPAHSIYMPILFGLGWGIGGLTWGLSIRYLGIGMGNSLPLGITMALSTIISPLVPVVMDPLQHPNGIGQAIGDKLGLMFSGRTGTFVLAGIIVSLLGVIICGIAASFKDKDLKGDVSEPSSSDFSFKKGVLVALVAGVMSACFAFGESAGQAMIDVAKQFNPGSIWVNNPVYAVILIGGFVANMVYCLWISMKNKSFADYSKPGISVYFVFAAIAGLLWFSQFVFKGMGTNKMSADMSYVTWCLLFSLVIVFSNVIGIFTGEWKGVSKRTIYTLTTGLVVLIGSVLIIGFAKVL